MLLAALYDLSVVIIVQPYVEQTLIRFDLEDKAPLASGRVFGAMTGLSGLASRFSVKVLPALGTVRTLLLSMLLQVLLVSAMAWIVHRGVAVALVRRMLPTALSHPALIATVQPRLKSEYRATYLSFQNLSGRLLLSGSIMAGAWAVADTQTLNATAMGTLIPYYAIGGWIVLGALWFTARRLKLFVHK